MVLYVGFHNDCGGETVTITHEVVGNDDVDMTDWSNLRPTSPYEAANIGNLYSRAHKINQNDGAMCIPTDEITHDNAELNIKLEVSKERMEEVMDVLSPDPLTRNEVEYEWEKKSVTDEQIRLMREWQSHKLPVNEIESDENINRWFEYLPIRAPDGNYR